MEFLYEQLSSVKAIPSKLLWCLVVGSLGHNCPRGIEHTTRDTAEDVGTSILLDGVSETVTLASRPTGSQEPYCNPQPRNTFPSALHCSN